MRIFNDSVLDNGVMTGTSTLNSDLIWLGHIVNWSLQGVWTRTSGPLTGSWKVQVSNAPVQPNTTSSKPTPDSSIVWTDLASASGSIVDAASGSFGLNLADAGYLWARIVYTNVTGTGVLNIRVNGKGV